MENGRPMKYVLPLSGESKNIKKIHLNANGDDSFNENELPAAYREALDLVRTASKGTSNAETDYDQLGSDAQAVATSTQAYAEAVSTASDDTPMATTTWPVSNPKLKKNAPVPMATNTMTKPTNHNPVHKGHTRHFKAPHNTPAIVAAPVHKSPAKTKLLATSDRVKNVVKGNNAKAVAVASNGQDYPAVVTKTHVKPTTDAVNHKLASAKPVSTSSHAIAKKLAHNHLKKHLHAASTTSSDADAIVVSDADKTAPAIPTAPNVDTLIDPVPVFDKHTMQHKSARAHGAKHESIDDSIWTDAIARDEIQNKSEVGTETVEKDDIPCSDTKATSVKLTKNKSDTNISEKTHASQNYKASNDVTKTYATQDDLIGSIIEVLVKVVSITDIVFSVIDEQATSLDSVDKTQAATAEKRAKSIDLKETTAEAEETDETTLGSLFSKFINVFREKVKKAHESQTYFTLSSWHQLIFRLNNYLLGKRAS